MWKQQLQSSLSHNKSYYGYIVIQIRLISLMKWKRVYIIKLKTKDTKLYVSCDQLKYLQVYFLQWLEIISKLSW